MESGELNVDNSLYLNTKTFKSFESYIYEILCKIDYKDLRPTQIDEPSGQIFLDPEFLFNKLKFIFQENNVYWDVCDSGVKKKYSFLIKTKKYDINDKCIDINFSFVDGNILIDSSEKKIKINCKKIWLDHKILYDSIKKIFLEVGFYGK